LDIEEVVELLPQTEVTERELDTAKLELLLPTEELDTAKLELLLPTEDFNSVSWSNILVRFNAVDAGFVPTNLVSNHCNLAYAQGDNHSCWFMMVIVLAFDPYKDNEAMLIPHKHQLSLSLTAFHKFLASLNFIDG
jgi:hypothetical protein